MTNIQQLIRLSKAVCRKCKTDQLAENCSVCEINQIINEMVEEE